MNATHLAKELNKRGKMLFLDDDEKMLQRDIKQLWMIGAIDGDKPSHNMLGRTKFKLKDVDFNVDICEKEILKFIEDRDKRKK